MMAIPVFPETKVALKGRKGLVVGIANDQSIGHALTAAILAVCGALPHRSPTIAS
jgi:enoyl-[acyl-carrier protein] reductase I